MYDNKCSTMDGGLWKKKVWVGFGFKCCLWHSSCIYRCVEQSFQHAKAIHAKDPETAAKIMLSREMKYLGGRIPTHESWTDI